VANILGVGIATLDIINEVDGLPPEDAEVRALGQQRRRGGNATNTLVVLSRLGHRCGWAGVLADEPDAAEVLTDLERHGIDTGAVQRSGGKLPTSYVTLNRRNGSRTIVHWRDLPEYPFDQFRTVALNRYDWLHFEGRNVEETGRMLGHAAATRPGLPRSLEIEKPRHGIEGLLPHAELLLFSRVYARERGFDSAEALLRAMRPLAPDALMVCGWGDAGAWATAQDGRLLYTPAFPPPRLVDTLGAGDTFNGGMIDGLLRGKGLAGALEAAARLAGRKCGVSGFEI